MQHNHKLWSFGQKEANQGCCPVLLLLPELSRTTPSKKM